MRHSPIALYPATAALAALVDRVYKPVEAMSLEEIRASRGRVYPSRPPGSWVTGSVDRRVGITYGTAPARDGYEIPLRLYRPRWLRDTDRDTPVIVFLHGGGFVHGGVLLADPLCAHLAQNVRAAVVSVDYRLAPEHRAPTAALDAIDATAWIATHADVLRVDGSRIAVCGVSAGGTLAAVVAQAFRDRYGTTSPLRHQALVYPATDMTMSSPSIDLLADAPLLTRTSITAYRAHYLPPGADLTDPLVSPLHGRLDGLPPALVQTADIDPLRDDGIRYAAALQAAGVPARLTNYVRAPHGFAEFPGVFAAGAQHRAELVDALHSHLYADADPPLRPHHR
jgi:acetyl esterase